MKTLVVFHSRSGHTRRVAQALARRLKADLEEIEPLQPHPLSPFGYAQCAVESMAALTPALSPSNKDPRRYALILVGTPIWFWGVAGPVRTWLVQQREALGPARLAFFCTMGGSGASSVFASMARMVGREPLATLALTQAQAGRSNARTLGALLDRFVQAIQARPSRRQPASRRTPSPALRTQE